MYLNKKKIHVQGLENELQLSFHVAYHWHQVYNDNYVYNAQIISFISLASFLWDIGKQYSPRCDAADSAASHLGLFCLLREISSKMR